MQMVTCLALALAVMSASDSKLRPPPVVLDLGPVVPTPAPTPEPAGRKRLITAITVQNRVDGETKVTFEATDIADMGAERTRTLAAANYSLDEDKPELRRLRDEIMQQLRDLERQLLSYAEKAGPPKERSLLAPQGDGPVK